MDKKKNIENSVNELPKNVEVIGVRFKDAGKIYYFSPENLKISSGDRVIVETARGLEYGFVADGNHTTSSENIVPPLRKVVRIAGEDDKEQYERNKELEKRAMSVCREKISEHGLGMKLIDAEYTFDNSKLMFYFTAESRVDFRELVKDLASIFKTRIELRQIGIRDEAKMLGGLGICGRPFCCSSFLSDFAQVSIKMAKEQNLSLNSVKISGACGRLMCCLRYEHETYERERKLTPKIDSKVKTKDGIGVVTDANILTGLVKVKFYEDKGEVVRVYDRGDVKTIKAREDENKTQEK